MKDFILIGKIVATHGIEGKVKVISDTNHKDKVFQVNNNIYIDNSKYIINSYQISGKYVILSFKDYLNINLINPFLKKDIYIKRKEISLENNEFLYAELIGMGISENNKKIGIVKEVLEGKKYPYLKIKNSKEYLIPLVDYYIKKIDREKEIIEVENVTNLMSI